MIHPLPGVTPTEGDLAAINYLFAEWDYCYDPVALAPSDAPPRAKEDETIADQHARLDDYYATQDAPASPPAPVAQAEEALGLTTAQLIERDRSKLAAGLSALDEVIRRREWLAEGRGPFEWDDDRYRDEFTATAAEIRAAVADLRSIARDWTGCPTDSALIAASRASRVAGAEGAK